MMIELFFLAAAAIAAPPHQGWPVGEISRLDVQLPSGDLVIQEADRGVAQVQVRKVAWAEGCGMELGRNGERAWLRVTSPQSAEASERPCHLEVAVAMGPHTTLAVDVGQGSVRVVRMSGSLTADLSVGDLILDHVAGAVDAELGQGNLRGVFTGPRIRAAVGAGEISLTELVALADVEVGMGNVELLYRHTPLGKVSARTGTGRVHVLLPSTTLVDTSWSVGMGSARIDLPEAPGVGTRVELAARIGRVVLESNQSDADEITSRTP